MIINVTQRHIDQGCRGSVYSCPIARAIQEKTGVLCGVRYDHVFIRGRELHLPHKAFVFITNYDEGEPVQPFRFELEGV
jgi:hypothetical protein